MAFSNTGLSGAIEVAYLVQSRLKRFETSTSPSVGALAIVFVGIITVVRWLSKGAGRSSASVKLPAANFGWPIVGNIWAYSADPIAYLRKATARYGNRFQVNMVFTNTIWLRGTQMNKLYLETREDTWSFGDGMGLFLNKVTIPGYFDHLKNLVGSLSRGINRKATLEHFAGLIEQESRQSLAEWAQKDEVALFEHVSVLVHKIIVRCLMGQDFYEHNMVELYQLLHDMEADIGNMLNFILPDWVPHPPARRLWKAGDRVGEIFAERLRERAKEPERWKGAQDYVSFTLTDPATAHLKGFFAAHHTLLMFAAHTSTVASISWNIIELLRHPAHVEALRRDLDGTAASEVSPYLAACLRETGRLYSGINMLRLARRDVTLPASDVVVPRGSVVSISPYLTHHDSTLFSNPDEWHPERWLEEPDLHKRMNADGGIAYMPFGAGSHRCPGEKMAVVITQTLVASLMRDYEVGWGKAGSAQDLSDFNFAKIGSPWLKGDAMVSICSKAKASG
ncbi:MAG: hypothetical protein M1817_000829 [Caeruleum heppii]|nr:MAG: hypothetical protein M1817_000829 [Caeruleum heppii]